MSTIQERISSFLVGFYTWIVTVFFGAVLFDTAYSKLIPEASAAFSEISDFLLLIGFVTVLAGVGAIASSWKLSGARNFFIASLVIILFEFLIPVFLSQLIQDTQASGLGTLFRIILNGMASMLAMLGLYKFYRQR
jgi:hypothetical protein